MRRDDLVYRNNNDNQHFLINESIMFYLFIFCITPEVKNIRSLAYIKNPFCACIIVPLSTLYSFNNKKRRSSVHHYHLFALLFLEGRSEMN